MMALVFSARSQKRFDYADLLDQQIRALRLPMAIREHRPFADRKFQLDLAWPDRMIFIECDGGEYLRSVARRHGGATDCERWNKLTLAGWTGFRFVGSQVKNGTAIKVVEYIFQQAGG